jgi:hypothetical protein
MASYSVADPQIDELLDLETGEYLNARELIGTDYGHVMQLRMALRTDIAAGTPRYGCALCGVPVYLVRMAQAEHFFFRHQLEDGRCPAQTRGQLSETEILARKYDGAKESRLHQRMKEWIARSLAADPKFSDIQTEVTWKGTGTGRWRRPDVRARYGDLPVAFEVQLSTTFIRVIAERRQFYLSEGGLLFWVFGSFGEADRRLTEDDVFYNNNRNAFVVSAQTAEASAQAGQFHLDCYWSDPVQSASGSLQYRRVSFAQLSLDQASQRAFHFDFDHQLAALHAQERERRLAVDAPLRARFDAFWLAYMTNGPQDDAVWLALHRELKDRGVPLPRYPGQFMQRQLLNALYSAREGRPIGFGFSIFIELAHWIASSHKGYLRAFRHALEVYRRAEQLKVEDHTGKWRAKVAGYKPKLAANDPAYAPVNPYPELVAFLFPELL